MTAKSKTNRVSAEDYTFAPAERFPLTDECKHYESKNQVPGDIQKYFSQRYSIWQYYDEGVYMTDDAWFGVTPEPIANQVAQDMIKTAKDSKKVLIDMFAGAGGNSIAFAASGRWDFVIAVEEDASTLACAQSNAETYWIEEGKIKWVHGDSFEFLHTLRHNPEQLHPSLRVDTDTLEVFASPPWGGPGYTTDEIFDLYGMLPYGLRELHGAYQGLDHALFVPRTSDLRQIAQLAPGDKQIEVVQYCMEGASKAMVAYIPAEALEDVEELAALNGHTSTDSTDKIMQ